MTDTIESVWRSVAISDEMTLAAQVLLAHVLQQDRAYLYTYPERIVSAEEKARYDLLWARYKAGEPLAYLVGQVDFYSHTFFVNQDVLIPRPETETLVDEAIKALHRMTHAPAVLELGTGSGAVAISLAAQFQRADIVAVDLSAAALHVALLNAQRHGCHNIRFIQSDWFQQVPIQAFDCIVSNPPYLRIDEWEASVALHHEPSHAFIGGEDGLAPYRIITRDASRYLASGGMLLFEHGYTEANAVRDILKQAGYCDIFSVRDLLGHERVTGARFDNHST